MPLVPRRKDCREVDSNLRSVVWIWLPNEFHLGYMVFKIIFCLGCQPSSTGTNSDFMRLLETERSGSIGSSSMTIVMWWQVCQSPRMSHTVVPTVPRAFLVWLLAFVVSGEIAVSSWLRDHLVRRAVEVCSRWASNVKQQHSNQ